jgi:phosphoglycolate phosphatase
MPARFDLVIADLDGTLVDSEALLTGLVAEMLVAHGHPAPERRAIAATIGLPLDEVFRRALPSAPPPAIDALCIAYRRRADAADFVRCFRLYDGVAATLDWLKRSGIRTVVATSKGRKTTLDILEHCGIDRAIDEVLGGDCVTRGKPHPEMVERALERFATRRERALVVGDTSFDIEMGQAAGVATCAVTYGMHGAESLRALGPTYAIDRFEALKAILAVDA